MAWRAARSIPTSSAGRLVDRLNTCRTSPTLVIEGHLAGKPATASITPVQPAVVVAHDVEEGGGEGGGAGVGDGEGAGKGD